MRGLVWPAGPASRVGGVGRGRRRKAAIEAGQAGTGAAGVVGQGNFLNEKLV